MFHTMYTNNKKVNSVDYSFKFLFHAELYNVWLRLLAGLLCVHNHPHEGTWAVIIFT